MNYTLSKILGWIGENKLITFLSICLFAFVIATIALASEKSSLEEQLGSCKDSLHPTPAPEVSSTTTSQDTSTTEDTDTGNGNGEPAKPPPVLPNKRMMDVLGLKF